PKPLPASAPASAPTLRDPSAAVATPPAPARAIARADSTPLPPASSGFARALDPRAIVTTPPPAATSGAATDSMADAAPAIDMQVAMPAIQGGDSVAVPRQKNDSTMKKILRALNGGKTP